MNGINLGVEDLSAVTPVTEPQRVEKTLIDLIMMAYCDECTAAHQYCIASHIARGEGYCDAVPEYDQHAAEEHDHAHAWLKRLEELDVKLNYDLVEIQNNGNPWTPIKTENVKEQLDILIKAEVDAQNFYLKIIEKARAEGDWITEPLAKKFLADEKEHETDLRRIREQFA